MNEPQRYHAQNPLDPRAKPGIMYPGEHGEWVSYEDYKRLAEKASEELNSVVLCAAKMLAAKDAEIAAQSCSEVSGEEGS